MKSDRLTVADKLLLAALELRKKSETFTAEDLVVEAWRQFPDTFGLSGYADAHPDSNRVLTNIMGTKGMRGKKWLRKVGEKQYRLTSVALSDGEGLIQQHNAESGTEQSAYLRAELDRNTSAALDRIVSSIAARKILESTGEEITFNDACGFWDITVRSNANTLSARLADATVLLDRANELLEARGSVEGLKVGSQNITKEQVESLRRLHQEMQVKFKTELDILRRRTDERLEKRRR